MQHVIALARTAVMVRHWFEIDLDDSSMEHGARIELRERVIQPHRGSESASQLLVVDRPLWRADLFDRLTDAPGTFRAAHYHPQFDGNEPCDRHWDPHLSASPWDWLNEQFRELGHGSWQLDPADARELPGLAGPIVGLAQQMAPDQCRSAADCFERTRDVQDAVQMMLAELNRPDLLDTERVSPWAAAA
jgi:hypothetical protein